MSQLPLSLTLPDSATVTEFFVTEANALAYGWVERWPDWPAPYQCVNIFGPKGCGKSHLAAIFATKLHCKNLDSLSRFEREIIAPYDGIVLDRLSQNNRWNEEALFHLMNYLSETGKSALILSQE